MLVLPSELFLRMAADGVPGWSGYDSNTANSAITQAETAKNTYGATVYSIGIFPGADATSAGNQNGNETEKANWFMQRVSSNTQYPQSPSYYLSAFGSILMTAPERQGIPIHGAAPAAATAARLPRSAATRSA